MYCFLTFLYIIKKNCSRCSTSCHSDDDTTQNTTIGIIFNKEDIPTGSLLFLLVSRGRILGRNWDKSLKSFLPCYSQSPLLTPPLSKSGLKLVCNVNIVHGNLTSANSQEYAQKPQRNLYVNEFGFW